MHYLNKLRDYLIDCMKPVKLDGSKVFAWSEDGAISVSMGAGNDSFQIDYMANIRISELPVGKGQDQMIMYFLAQFQKTHQPQNTGNKIIKIDTELKKKNLFNFYISVPISEIITVETVDEGTKLNTFDVANGYAVGDPVEGGVTIQHVPGSSP